MFLEMGIFASHIIWRIRTRTLRKQAKLAGLSFDDLPEAQVYQVKKPDTERDGKCNPAAIQPGNAKSDVDHLQQAPLRTLIVDDRGGRSSIKEVCIENGAFSV